MRINEFKAELFPILRSVGDFRNIKTSGTENKYSFYTNGFISELRGGKTIWFSSITYMSEFHEELHEEKLNEN